GVGYAIVDEIVNGGTVVVTAMLEDGYEWGNMHENWTQQVSATATYTVEFDDVHCQVTVPVAPEVSNAVCTDGVLTDPSVTPVATRGVTYDLDEDDVVNGGSVEITATIMDGFAWGDLSDSGWTR